MTAADLAPILAGVGGVSGLGAAVRWWLDRSERIRREDLAREDARAEASVARGQATGAALASAAESVRELASAVARVPVALDAMDDRLDARFERVERALAEIRAHIVPLTGEHRAGGS